MWVQSLIVFFVVACCFVYAAWTLMPQAVRRAMVKGLLRLPLPPPWRPGLQQAASAATACHCSGCDHEPRKESSSSTVHVLIFHPRKRQ